MKISAPHIANLFVYGSYQELSETYLRTFLVHRTIDVCDPEKTVSDREFLAVLKELISKSNNPYFGLHYGVFLNIKALGFISQISLNASSIGQAVLILKEYLNNSFPLVSLSVSEGSDHYNLQLDSNIEDSIVRKHLLDITYCFMFRELRLMLNDEFEPMLQLPYDDLSPYSRAFDLTVKEGEGHLILLDNRVLETEINQKRIKELEYLLPKFILMLEVKDVDYEDFSIQVRNMTLSMCKPEIPTFEQVSKQFPLSNRTIQRKLATEGLSFRKISDDIRKEISTYLRIGKQMKTRDIAYVLGYSESSAYLHAVNRWESRD